MACPRGQASLSNGLRVVNQQRGTVNGIALWNQTRKKSKACGRESFPASISRIAKTACLKLPFEALGR